MSRIKQNVSVAAMVIFTLVGGSLAAWWVRFAPNSYLAADAPNASGERAGGGVPGAELEGAPDHSGNVVSLSDAKLAAAKIHVEPVDRGGFIQKHTVPGRVTYNDNRHIKIKTPTAGILTQVLVKPGDCVKPGQALAQLNCPQVGTARADVLKRLAEAEFANQLLQRATTIEQNVTALVDAVTKRLEFDALKAQFAGRMLGDYRQMVFGAYSRLLLAQSMVENSESLAESGVLAGKTLRERESEAQSALATLEATCEQAKVDVWRERTRDQNTARDASRRVEIARQHLASLLLSPSATTANPQIPETSEIGANGQELEGLSLVTVRAPIPGTIEDRSFSPGERVEPGDSLFVLADTQSLWIKAQVREDDWPAVTVGAGQTLELTAPALGDRELTATVYFVGREVSPQTNAIPIVAEIDNAEGLLRPGLFVRVTVPVGKRSDVLSVPSRAVLRHEGQAFVFVREAENRFRRVDVETGMQNGERVEIVAGLKPGQAVVSHGAFLLKSELLLESEEE